MFAATASEKTAKSG